MPRKGQSKVDQKNTKRGSAALKVGEVSVKGEVKATPEVVKKVESTPKKVEQKPTEKKKSLFKKG